MINQRRIIAWLRWSVLLALVFLGAAFLFSPALLRVESDGTAQLKADCLVVLGGKAEPRAQRAAMLFAQDLAPRVLVTGTNDCGQSRAVLLAGGVPAAAVVTECEARTTKENAEFCAPLLRAQKAQRVILVTSWYHSRRALRTFQKFAPEIQFFILPSHEGLPLRERFRIARFVLLEYPKMLLYAVRYHVLPF